MKAAGVIAAIAGVAGAVGAVVMITSTSGPSERPPAAGGVVVDSPDATAVEPDASAEEPDVVGAVDDASTDKRLIGEIVESWPGPDTFDDDPTRPISDEAWATNPCNPLAEMIVGAQKVDPAALEAQLSAARSHHPRNTGLDLLTWTYAGCLAVASNDPRPCYETPGVVMPQRCEDNLLAYRLAKATEAEACTKDVADFIEVKRDRLVGNQLCRAAAGDASACDNFRHPEHRWYCELLASRDPSADVCATVQDAESRQECPGFASLVRVVRGLPALDAKLDPDAPMAVMTHKITDPTFSCDDWYRAALRRLCR